MKHTDINMSDPDFGEKLREAIGVAPGDEVKIMTPQFERSPGDAPSKAPPAGRAAWDALRSSSRADLIAMGLRAWDRPSNKTILMLIPGEWHANIPDEFVLECINGISYTAGHDEIDDDIRFGCLAYGIRVVA